MYCRVTCNSVPFITKISKSLQKFLIHIIDSSKISYKKANVLRTCSSRSRHVQLSASKDVGDSGIRGMNSTRSVPPCTDDWPATRRTAFYCSGLAHGRASHRVHVQSLAERATRRRRVNIVKAIILLYQTRGNSDDGAVMKSKQTSQYDVVVQSLPSHMSLQVDRRRLRPIACRWNTQDRNY